MAEVKISLAAARVNAGLTQEEAAKLLKIGNRTLLNWEKGVAEPSFASLTMLSQIYGIPIDNIFLPQKST